MITIAAVLLIIFVYSLVITRNFFKDTEISKDVKEKMLLKSFRAAFITVIVSWGFLELFMIMRIDPSFDMYRIIILIIFIISLIVFGLNLKVQNQRPE